MKKLVLLIAAIFIITTPLFANDSEVERVMEVTNPFIQISGIMKLNSLKTKAFLQLYATLTVSDVRYLRNDFNYLLSETSIKTVQVYLNSQGGDAFSGLAMADEIARAKKMGFKIIGSTSGIVASSAVPVFAMLSNRTAAPGTIFMVHEASIFKWPGRETASAIEAQNKMLKMLRRRYLTILANNTKLSYEEWAEMEKNTTWFNAEQALEWGLVDEIE